ncbi:TPA: hypothetical protein QH074_004294 [Enterobacter hormaechei subsp. steigerwaltii]|nr:hypothetical protein [Enterobacter hormaechei subsp. steigerwaltii]
MLFKYVLPVSMLVLMVAGCVPHPNYGTNANWKGEYPKYDPKDAYANPVDLTTAEAARADRERAPEKPAPFVVAYDYGVAVGRLVGKSISEPQRYVGKTCRLRMRFDPAGELISANAISGDKDLCAVVISNARAIKYPTPPAGALDKNGYMSVLEFMASPPQEATVNDVDTADDLLGDLSSGRNAPKTGKPQ